MHSRKRWIGGWVLLAVAGGLASCSKGDDMHASPPAKSVLPSRLAGSWYTDDRNALVAELHGYLQAADTRPLPNVRALILPHAGYAYSGAVAAYGAKQVQGKKYGRVIVMGPSHRVALPDLIALPPESATHYSTLLGELPLDTAALARLRKTPLFQTVRGAQPGEHSVEMEFPLLQCALGEFPLVPLVVGQLSPRAAEQAGAALRELCDDSTLLVVSTDFTHFGPRFDYVPFDTDVETRLRELDLGAFDCLHRKDAAGFREYIGRTGATICGRDALSVLLAALPAEAQVHLLKYDTSGRMTGDWENTVSYVSAAVTARKNAAAGAPAPTATVEPQDVDLALDIPDADRQALLKLARATIARYFETRRKADLKDLGISITPGMKHVAGAFVTLHLRGELRGCIGEIVPERELWKAVQDHALNAAFRDPRFEPLAREELDACEVEISALSEPHPVAGWRDIQLGKHGIVLRKDGRTAVFLPQVAPEQGWDAPTTLRHLSMKAGLPPDAWQEEGCEFFVFEAVVFREGGAVELK